jgi:DNA modification methylase
VKPYFEEDGITIYHGDYRDILPMLSGTVITDPPYNIGYKYGDSYKDNLSENEYRELIFSGARAPSVVIHYPENMFFVSRALGRLPEKCVAWTYNGLNSRNWRMIAWYGITPDFTLVRQPYKNLEDPRILAKLDAGSQGCALYDWWHDEKVNNVSQEKFEHPCQVPLGVMDKILRITPCEKVIDPFCGSGTTLRAAKNLGRRAIGIEIEERYCEIAVRRLSQKVLPF